MVPLITEDELTAAVPSLATRTDLDLLIGAATVAIERHCDRTFSFATEIAEYLDGNNRSAIWLARPPIADILSITVNGVALDNSDGNAWTYDPNTGELIRGEGQYDPRFANWWAKGFRNVLVVYNGGFNPVPDDVKSAAIAMVKWLVDSYRITGILSSEKIGDYQYAAAIGAGFPATVAAILAPYRRTWIV